LSVRPAHHQTSAGVIIGAASDARLKTPDVSAEATNWSERHA
jgi:hypothetical protein